MPAEIAVLSALAIREAYLELVPQFEGKSGHRVVTTWTGTADIQKRMAAGETYDLVSTSAAGLDDLVKQHLVVADTAVPVASCGIGVGVRAGASRPDIGSAEALKAALLSAESVGFSTGPSGIYVKSLFERLSVADAVAAKTKVVPSGGTIGSLIASGEAALGFQQVPELIHVEGVDFVGPLPAGVQHVTTFSGAVHRAARAPDAAKEWLAFLTGPDAAAVLRRHGLEPGA